MAGHRRSIGETNYSKADCGFKRWIRTAGSIAEKNNNFVVDKKIKLDDQAYRNIA